jgi:hypothetical protein
MGVRRVLMLSNYWFYFCGYCCSPVFKKENSAPDQRMVQTKTTLHTQKSYDLGLSEGNDCKLCLRLDGLSFYEFRNLHPIIGRRNTYEKQNDSAFIHYARLFGHWKCFQRLEILRCFVPIQWIYCLKTCFLLQTYDNEYSAILFIDYSVFSCSLHSITISGSTIL